MFPGVRNNRKRAILHASSVNNAEKMNLRTNKSRYIWVSFVRHADFYSVLLLIVACCKLLDRLTGSAANTRNPDQ